MGKQKRKVDSNKTPPPSDITPFSPQEALRLKRARYYSKRSFSSQFDASTSNLTGPPVCDAKLSFKLTSKDNSDLHHRENKDRAFQKPERIRSSSSLLKVVSSNMRKIECGICHKCLAKKPFFLYHSISPSDVSIVAVLVCGHAYHADCLEEKTSHEDRHDPPCPLCNKLDVQATPK